MNLSSFSINPIDYGNENIPNDLNQSKNDSIVQLKQKIMKLEEENRSIRSQFDEAMKVSREMDLLFNKNNELSKINRELETEIDDLKKRLEISFNLNDELQAKAEQEKIATKTMMNNESHNFQQKLKDCQQQLESQNQALKIENDKLKNKIKAVNDGNSTLNSEISLLLSISGEKFHSKFDSLPALNKFIRNLDLLHYNSSHKYDEDTRHSHDEPYDFNTLLNRYNRLKSKYMKLRNVKESLQNENNLLQDDFQSKKEEYEKSMNAIQVEIEEINKQQKLEEIEREQEKVKLQNTIDRLKETIQKLSSKLDEKKYTLDYDSQAKENNQNNQLSEQQEIIENLTSEIRHSKKSKEKCKKQITSLISQIEEIEEIKNQLELKYDTYRDKSKSKIALLKQTIRDLSNESNSYIEKLKSVESQYENAHANLNQLKVKIGSLENKYNNINTSFISCESQLKSQSQEILKLSLLKDSQSSVIQKLLAALMTYEKQCKNQIEKIESMKKRINNEHFLRKEQHISDILPESCWICMDLPKDLCDAIAEIGRITIQPADQRLKQALSIIALYIHDKYNQWKADFSEQETKFSSLSNILKLLLQAINNQIGDPKIEYDILVCNPSLVQEILSRLNRFNNDDEISHENKKFETTPIQSLLNALGSSTLQNAEDAVDKMKKSISNQNNEIKLLKNKNRQLKSALNQYAKDLDYKKNELISAISKEKKNSEEIQNSLNNQIQENINLNSKVISLQNDISNLEEKHKEELESLKNEQLSLTHSICQNMKNDCEMQLKRKEQDLIKARSNAEKVQTLLDKARAKNKKLQSEINDKVMQNQKLQESIVQSKKMQKEQYNMQLKNVTDQYHEAVDVLKRENQQKDEEIQVNKKALRDVQMKVSQLSESKAILENEKQQLVNNINAHKQELEREKRLSATKLKALTLSSEMKIQNETENARLNFEQQKREIFHFAADVFKQFFDPRMQITESSFKTILQNVKARLDNSVKQEETIKRILGIIGNENIETALIRTLSSAHQKSNIIPSNQNSFMFQ